MKKVIKILLASIAFLSVAESTLADEKDFGTATPTEDEIIKHFQDSAPKTETTPANDDDYQDVSESDLRNVRGLKKIDLLEKAVPKKPKASEAFEEKAISLQVLFGYDSDVLTQSAKDQLAPIGRALASGELKELKFKIEGHTDIIGSDAYNIDLSRRRANSVKQYLIDHYGIAPSALEIEGKGETGLADSANPTSEVNRRVRIVGMGHR